MNADEQALMAELESIINGVAQDLNDERKTQHLASMPFLAEAAREAISHKETEAKPIHLFAIQEVAKESMDEMTLIDGTPVSREKALADDELIGARFSYVHAFDSTDDALSVLADPETAIAFEGTMPDSGLYLEAEVAGDKVSALFAAQCLTLRKHIGTETVTHYAEPNSGIDPDDFLVKQVGLKPETANLIKGLVMFRNNPLQMRRNYPNTFAALYEKWKDKMRKATEGEDE